MKQSIYSAYLKWAQDRENKELENQLYSTLYKRFQFGARYADLSEEKDDSDSAIKTNENADYADVIQETVINIWLAISENPSVLTKDQLASVIKKANHSAYSSVVSNKKRKVFTELDKRFFVELLDYAGMDLEFIEQSATLSPSDPVSFFYNAKLSERENRILEMLYDGMSYEEVKLSEEISSPALWSLIKKVKNIC